MKKNILTAAVTFGMYLLNRTFRSYLPEGALRYFLFCYFNDIVGSVTFMSLVNILLTLLGFQRITKLVYIEVLLLGAGLFWEYAAPLFRSDTFSDPIDLLAYLLGGMIYHIVLWVKVKKKEAH